MTYTPDTDEVRKHGENQGDGWNSDAHDPADDNPYRKETT